MMQPKKKKREPNCAVCINHGKRVALKGHKRHCAFRYCRCAKCVETKDRQEYMADMQYIKRNGVAEEARLGKRADMLAIYNERMKNKKSKKKELDGLIPEGKSDSPVDKLITLESVDSTIEDLLGFFHDELKVTDEYDIIFHSLVALAHDLDEASFGSVFNDILALFKEDIQA